MTQQSLAPGERRDVPGECGLYGLGYYTAEILQLCQAAGIRVAFVIDDCPESQPGYVSESTCLVTLRSLLRSWQIPVWTDAELFRQVEQKAALPPLIASRIENWPNGSVGTDPYLRGARRLREVSEGRCSLLHPVILSHALALPAYQKRIALFGYPGSGNILAKHLLDALDERRDDPVPPRVGLVAAFAEHYYLSTLALLRDLLKGLGPVAMELAAYQFPTANLSLALPGGEYALAQHIPCNRHLASYFHHTHAIPSRLAVDELTRLGAACVAVIRHPCETVLSWASKLSRPPAPVLDNAAFFRDSLAMLAEWFHQLHANEGRLTVVRYEDLEARQARPLQVLAERLGVALRDDEIGPLYGHYLHRDLLPGLAPRHYYRGGNDKWRGVFRPWHVRQMKALGFGPICQRWGYDLTPPVRSPRVGPRVARGPSGQKSGVIPLDTPHGLAVKCFAPRPFPLFLQSRSRAVNRLLQDVLHGPEFLGHLSAGGLGPDSPPWVAPIPWESLVPIYLPGQGRRRWPGLTGLLHRLSFNFALRG
jgi:hypothetical protein